MNSSDKEILKLYAKKKMDCISWGVFKTDFNLIESSKMELN